ncbi:hypothetical protein [Undibacterium sp. TJN19]|uniref:hypothetical protein n=1 Tax=Undibacterium sp. TJN19 TaxID=3413055 RepID=UPI003BF0D872
MSNVIKMGDRVILTGVPEWLVHDLPEEEKTEIYSCIGKAAVITEIDKYGYYWLGFGSTVEHGDTAFYSGHAFCVSGEYLKIEPIDSR